MKNVQVIDGATNCAYAIYQLTDEEFAIVFPASGQDIEFIGDVADRIGEKATGDLLRPAWSREVAKQDVVGIHGTLFYQLDEKREFYPNKRDTDVADR